MTSTWDKNGACVECGYTPFQLTEFCSQCNPTKLSNKFNENEKIKNIEEGLFQHGVQYLFMNDLIGMPIIYQDDYDELDKYLRTYKHVNYFITPFTGEKVFDPEKQLVTRVKEFLKTTIEYNSMDEFDEFDEVKEEEISEGKKAEKVDAEPLAGDPGTGYVDPTVKMAATDPSEEDEDELPKLDGAPIDEQAQKTQNGVKLGKNGKVVNTQQSFLSRLYK